MSSPDDAARAFVRAAIAHATKAQNAISAKDKGAGISRPCIDLFDPAEIRRKLGDEPDYFGIEIGDSPSQTSSNEESEWQRRLKALLNDPQNPGRSLVIADEAMVTRIEAIRSQSPHFGEVIGLVSRAAQLSLVTQSPLAIPPLLLIGSPGIGKTFFARSLAEAIGTHLERVAMDVLSDHGVLTGLSLSWKAARPGRIALGLLESRTASPIFLLDEVDKTNPNHSRENPLAFLHSVLEPENARRFADEYLTITIRADHAIWILTANDAEILAESLLDRLTIFSVPEPSTEAIRAIVDQIYASTNAQFNGAFEAELDREIVDQLASYNPRSIGKLLKLAFGFAAGSNRASVKCHDIERARLLIQHSSLQRGIGFL
jgi:ATP-dependent Lon protease